MVVISRVVIVTVGEPRQMHADRVCVEGCKAGENLSKVGTPRDGIRVFGSNPIALCHARVHNGRGV